MDSVENILLKFSVPGRTGAASPHKGGNMTITYRTRRRFQRFLKTLAWLLVLLAAAWIIWMVWLHRYVVYSRDGVFLDFSHSSVELSGEVAKPPVEETVSIYYNEGSDKVEATPQLTQLVGVIADTDALMTDLDAVRTQIEALPAGAAVMLDLKSGFGNFYYSTGIEGAETTAHLDVAAMDDLIAWLKTSELYTIARVPAFRDRNFGLYTHQNGTFCGLPEAAGNLWEDADGCYWLDPAAQGTKDYLVEIINELRVLGFDEVVFTDFCFPDSGGKIVYESEQTPEQIIQDTASGLVSICATGSFAVSFQGGTDFPLPLGRSRLYLEGVAADKVEQAAQQTAVSDKLLNLVFLAQSNDTRYSQYSALRQLHVGQTEE